MGKKSTKENKNIYHISRENAGLTRERAADVLGFISADRFEKIENRNFITQPDEILAMADGYKNPSLFNYYCSQICPIGQEYVPKVTAKDLSVITLEMLSTLNTLVREKDRLIDIAADGEISEDEIPDFIKIQSELDRMSLTIDSLKLWVDNTIASGKIDRSLLKKQETQGQ
ncbi:MAG: helix-turn-helix transcriptional regulator [Lachnospiraceae bacterium]|nr:helix-turn-helix transcriptional regulator [Lachnospiraceae bacterium]